jgi:CubicO group peptidase (beta-lactamase class C family)
MADHLIRPTIERSLEVGDLSGRQASGNRANVSRRGIRSTKDWIVIEDTLRQASAASSGFHRPTRDNCGRRGTPLYPRVQLHSLIHRYDAGNRFGSTFECDPVRRLGVAGTTQR